MIVNQGVFLVSYLFLNVTGVNSGDQKAKNYVKNPAYGRQSISQPMQIVAPMP